MPERERIQNACATRAAATLIVQDQLLQARFDVIEADLVSFVCAGSADVSPPTMVCVTFRHEQRAAVFVSGIVAVDSDDDFSHILVQMPKEVATAETRSVFRVPVSPSTGLHASISRSKASASLKDISTAGACVCIAPPHPERGARFVLTLELDGTKVDIDAVVVRREHDHIGVRFPAPVSDALGDIVRECERRWLRARRRAS